MSSNCSGIADWHISACQLHRTSRFFVACINILAVMIRKLVPAHLSSRAKHGLRVQYKIIWHGLRSCPERVRFGAFRSEAENAAGPLLQPRPLCRALVRFHRHTSRHDPFLLRSLMQMQLDRTENWCVFASHVRRSEGISTGAPENFQFRLRIIIIGPLRCKKKKQASTFKR